MSISLKITLFPCNVSFQYLQFPVQYDKIGIRSWRQCPLRILDSKQFSAFSGEPAAISRGWRAVRGLQASMDEGRRRRLAYIGFPDDEAAELSALHTRNFM